MAKSDSTCSSMSLSTALREKYLDSPDVVSHGGIFFPTVGGGHREIEYVRSDKLSKQLKYIEKRSEIDLKNCGINEVEIAEDLATRLCNVRVMDLAFNLISSWKDFAIVCNTFASLEHLIVTGNPLQVPLEDELRKICASFTRLKTITMGKLNYDWDTIYLCSNILWPKIECLDIFSNRISQLSWINSSDFTCLKTLVLSGNSIVDWFNINQLASLEKLENLQLVDCKLKSISFPSNLSKPFISLRHLNVRDNNLRSWRDVAELNKLPYLEELIIKKNPIFEEIHHDYAFNCVLSIIGSVKNLNRQEITSSTRKDGEIHYLRFMYRSYREAKLKSENSFFEENPRYLHLIEKYGEPADLLKEQIKESSMVLVKIVELSSDRCLTKKLPKRLTIHALKILIKRLFRIDDLVTIELSSIPQEDHGQSYKIILDKDDSSLDFFSIQDGHTIYFESKA